MDAARTLVLVVPLAAPPADYTPEVTADYPP